MREGILTLLLLINFLNATFPQAGKKFIINEFNTENGLPANGIKGLTYDNNTHFLWIATESGIVRYNGQEFKIYTKKDLPQLASERISKLTRSNSGEILIFDTELNIFRIEQNKPDLIAKARQKKSDYGIKRISSKFQNRLLRNKIEEFNLVHAINTENPVLDLGDTACVVTTVGKEIVLLNAGRKSFDTIAGKTTSANTLFKVGKDCFFTENDGKIYRINLLTKQTEELNLKFEFTQFSSDQIRNGLISWDNGNSSCLFFLANNAYQLLYENNTLTAKLICDEIPTTSNIRYAEYAPSVDKLFLGTQSKGVTIISRNHFTSVKKPLNDPLIPNAAYTQIALANGQILTNDIVLYGKTTVHTPVVPINEKFGFTTYLFGDSLLLYSKKHDSTRFHTVHSYNFRTGITTGYSKIRINTTFGAAVSNGKIYLICRNGFGMLDGDKLNYLIKPKDSTESISVMDMETVSPGVFIAVSCSGLIRFDANKKTTDTLIALPGNCFRNIEKIGDYFFIGTYGGGYFIYKDGIVKKMPLDKEKYLLYTHCFLPDRLGFCWISTNRGLFKAKLSDLISYFNEKADIPVYYQYYGKNDGIEMTELNGGCHPCAIELKDSTFSFPTMDGLSWFRPDKIPANISSNEIYIDEIIANDSIIPNDNKEITLLSDTKSILLKLGYSAWGNQQNLYLDYSLDKGASWKPIKTEQGAFIQLDNLPAGKYEITIRKLKGFGKENFVYKRIQFVIEKPWFNSWWFYLLCIIGAIGLVRIYLTYKTKRLKAQRVVLERQVAEKTKALLQQNTALEKNNSVQARLISIISHDIITPLKFIAFGGRELIENKDRMPEELKQETIEEITHTAQELQLLSTNIMNWMKYQNENRKQVKETITLYDSSKQVTGILNSIARKKNILIKNNIPATLTIVQYNEPIKILLYNLLSNAINFSTGGTITIDATNENDNIQLSVSDEGMGMTPEQIKNILSDDFIISSVNIDNKKGNGLGYLIIKDLLKMLNATISFQSKRSEGTKVTVVFG